LSGRMQNEKKRNYLSHPAVCLKAKQFIVMGRL
jgi:hypothetical protein